METINQEKISTVSTIEKQKVEASEFIANRIEEIKGENNISTLVAAHQVYEEVKGVSYREEQAVAKLLEFLNLQNELGLRAEEITEKFPGLTQIVTKGVVSANNEKYLVAA
jgi:hypothetical protein